MLRQSKSTPQVSSPGPLQSRSRAEHRSINSACRGAREEGSSAGPAQRTAFFCCCYFAWFLISTGNLISGICGTNSQAGGKPQLLKGRAWQKKQRGLYLQVSGERAQAGGHLRKPQLGAVHRERDAVLFAVALRRAGGSSTWLHRQRLAAGTGEQENGPEEEESAHPGPGRRRSAPGSRHAAGTGSPAGPGVLRMRPGKGRHC